MLKYNNALGCTTMSILVNSFTSCPTPSVVPMSVSGQSR
jgi:hypothetical protein